MKNKMITTGLLTITLFGVATSSVVLTNNSRENIIESRSTYAEESKSTESVDPITPGLDPDPDLPIIFDPIEPPGIGDGNHNPDGGWPEIDPIDPAKPEVVNPDLIGEEEVIQKIKASGENVYYGHVSDEDFVYDYFNDEYDEYELKLYDDSNYSTESAENSLLIQKGVDTHDKTSYYLHTELGDEWKVSGINEFQDIGIINSIYKDSDNVINIDSFRAGGESYSGTFDKNISQYKTLGSDYNLIKVKLYSDTEDIHKTYWLALEVDENLIIDEAYHAIFNGEFNDLTVTFDKSYQDIVDNLNTYYDLPNLNYVVNYRGNIFDNDYIDSKGVNYVTETYKPGGWGDLEDSMSLNLWDNSITWSLMGLGKVEINTDEPLFTSSQISEISSSEDRLKEFYITVDKFLIDEYGSLYVDSFYNNNHYLDTNNWWKNIDIVYSSENEYGTWDTEFIFGTDSWNEDSTISSANTKNTVELGERLNSEPEFNIEDTYLLVEGDKALSYDWEIENFEKFVPLTKKIFIGYMVVIGLLIVGLVVLYIYRRKK